MDTVAYRSVGCFSAVCMKLNECTVHNVFKLIVRHYVVLSQWENSTIL